MLSFPPLHPATLLLIWGAGALLLPQLSLPVLGGVTAFFALLARRFAGQRAGRLLRRTRWLLLSLFVLFAFFTPGVYLVAPLTLEGLQLAGEHILRLVALLLTLALLHEHLGAAGLLGGFYWLLTPLAGRGRERIVARLMLVIEFAEKDKLGWRDWLADEDSGPALLTLTVQKSGWGDWLILALLTAALGAWTW